MYQASEQFNAAILGNQRKFQARIKTGKDEATSGFLSVLQSSRSTADDFISIGDVVSSYVEIRMYDPGFGLENTELEVSVGLLVDGEVEYVPLGLFTAQKPLMDDGVVAFTAYDRIQSRMSGAFFSELSYPVDGKDVLREISEKTGVPINVSNLPDGVMIPKRAVVSEAGADEEGNEVTNTTYTAPFDGYLYREALGYIAQFYCKFATVNRSGTVELRWYTDVDYSIDANRYYDDLTTNEQTFTVGAITCTAGDTVLTAGAGAESIQLENPVMTQERLNAIYEEIKTLQFLPAGLSFYGDMRLDPGDVVTVNDKSGNIVRLPAMSITQDFDGGLLTAVQSFGRTEQEASAAKGPTAQKLDRVYTDLFLVKELVGNKADFDYVHGKVGEFDELKVKVATIDSAYIDKAEVNNLLANYATIDLANVQTGAIKTALIDTGAIQTAQIADGAITNLKVAGDLDATKITVGTLSVDRLIIRGSEKSLVYELNNITGALQAQSVDTLNGEILTPRTITADKVVANSITGNEIATKTITANNIVANSITGDEIAANTIKAINIKSGAITTDKLDTKAVTAAKIDVTDLFAQDIMATGTIQGAELVGAKISCNAFTATNYQSEGNLVQLSIDKSSSEDGITYNWFYVEQYSDDGKQLREIRINENAISMVCYDGDGRNYNGISSVNVSQDGRVTGYAQNGISFSVGSGKSISLWNSETSTNLVTIESNGNLQVPGTLTIDGAVTSGSSFRVGSTGYYNGYAELFGSTPFIDFHYGNSTADYTSRIIEGASGRLEIPKKLSVGGYANDGYALAASSIATNGSIYILAYGNGVQWKTAYGVAGINALSTGTTLNLYSLKAGETGWHAAITLVDENGDVQIAAKNHTHTNYLSLSGGTVTGEFKFNDYSGTNRRPASSAATDGARVSYIASKTRDSDGVKYVSIQGQYGTTGSTYNVYNYLSTSSDARLKSNVVPTKVISLDVIKQIKMRQFDWIDSGAHQRLGFVADELELIDTSLAFGGGYNDDGSMNVKSVNTLNLLAYVVKGMQEICASGNRKDATLATHEARIESLEYQLQQARDQIAKLEKQIDELKIA